MHPGEATTRTVVPPAREAPTPAASNAKPPPGEPRLLRLRWAIAAALLALAALAGLRLWFVDGLLRRVTIDGPSMAPALLGPRYALRCGDCRFEFSCDAEHPPASGVAVCPNCGFDDNDPLAADRLPAQRVLIDRWRLLGREVRRGEIVAASLPDGSGGYIVKRVAALAGERLAIKGGDLYVNDQLIRKSAAELRAVRALVHDDDFRPTRIADLPPRWRGAAGSTRWRATAVGYAVPENADRRAMDWLAYRHWPATGNPLVPRTGPVPIRDLDSFNQADTFREMQLVHDVQFTCRLAARGEGTLALAAVDRGQRLVVWIEPAARRLKVLSGETTLAEQQLPENLFASAELHFGLCDQQLLLSINGRNLLRLPYDRTTAPPTAGASPLDISPLEIGASGLALEISQLKVWRDIHYLPPSGLAEPWRAAAPLGPGQAALLGDSPPVSIDSRFWPDVGIPAESILGQCLSALLVGAVRCLGRRQRPQAAKTPRKLLFGIPTVPATISTKDRGTATTGRGFACNATDGLCTNCCSPGGICGRGTSPWPRSSASRSASAR